MALKASQFGSRARLRVLEGWVGINPAVTKPGSERTFSRKASSGGREPTGPGPPHQPRPPRTPPAAPSCLLGLVGVVPTMASGGQQVPTFPRSCLEAVCPTRWPQGPGLRPQGSAISPHPPNTDTDGTDGPVGTSCGQPGPCHLADCWASSLSQAARPRLKGRLSGVGALMSGRDWQGHRCAWQACPSNHDTQENAQAGPQARGAPLPCREQQPHRAISPGKAAPGEGGRAPQARLCPASWHVPAPCPPCQHLGSVKGPWPAGSSSTCTAQRGAQMESHWGAHSATGISWKRDRRQVGRGLAPSTSRAESWDLRSHQ